MSDLVLPESLQGAVQADEQERARELATNAIAARQRMEEEKVQCLASIAVACEELCYCMRAGLDAFVTPKVSRALDTRIAQLRDAAAAREEEEEHDG